MPFDKDRYIYNSTHRKQICLINKTGELEKVFELPNIEMEDVQNTELEDAIARPSWNRGLCLAGDYFFVGTSPATISLYNINESKPLKSVRLSDDIRNSIHGLEFLKN
jgi:hypothetical protein